MSLKVEFTDWLQAKVSDGYDEKSACEELQEHGCISGMVSELIYYSDTEQFFDRNKAEIVALTSDWCDGTGYTLKEFLSGANNFPLEKSEIENYHFVQGIDGLLRDFEDYEDQIKNWFAWFAFEETGYRYYSEKFEN